MVDFSWMLSEKDCEFSCQELQPVFSVKILIDCRLVVLFWLFLLCNRFLVINICYVIVFILRRNWFFWRWRKKK